MGTRVVSPLAGYFFAIAWFLTESSALHAQSVQRWTPLESIGGTNWAYHEGFSARNRLAQCEIMTESKSVNGASDTFMRIAILQKGGIVVSIEDEEWVRRINIDFGWRESAVFKKVLFFVGETRIGAAAYILPGLKFLIVPNDRQEFLSSKFFETEAFSVSVEGLTSKAFSTPKIALGWERLSKCTLFKNR